MSRFVFQGHFPGIGFLKIHAPWNILCREAEFMKLKMPTKKVFHLSYMFLHVRQLRLFVWNLIFFFFKCIYVVIFLADRIQAPILFAVFCELQYFLIHFLLNSTNI